MMSTGSGRAFSVGVRLLNSTVDKRLELVLDDLESTDEQNMIWRKWAFFTSMNLDRHRALLHELTETEYAQIGQAVMARLVALRTLEAKKE
jgi:hypothetical protein